jgi:hypothetical protein
MVDQTLQGTLLNYLWNPWVQVLAWLGPAGTATMAVGVTISMAIIGAFIYIAFRYFIIERFAKAAGGGGGYGGGINEDTNYKISLFLAVIFTFLMVYSGAMLIIAPLMVGMGGIIGVMVLVMITLILIGFTRRGFAISKEIGAENAKMRAGALKANAEAAHEYTEAKDMMAREGAEDTLTQKTASDVNKIAEELGKQAGAENQLMAFANNLDAMLANVEANLTRRPMLDEPTAKHLQQLAADMFKVDNIIEATKITGNQAGDVMGDINRTRGNIEISRKESLKIRDDLKKEKVDLDNEFNKIRAMYTSVEKLRKTFHDNPPKLGEINDAEQRIKKLEAQIKNAEAKLADAAALDAKITAQDTEFEKDVDTYSQAEKQAISKLTDVEANKVTRARALVVELETYFAANALKGTLATWKSGKLLDILASTHTLNEKRNAIHTVRTRLKELVGILTVAITLTMEFVRRQKVFDRFLTVERGEKVQRLKKETTDLTYELTQARIAVNATISGPDFIRLEQDLKNLASPVAIPAGVATKTP